MYYFSAYANWLPEKKKRHQNYVNALKESKVVPVLGHFKKKTRTCIECHSTWIGHEEKETDVNIAILMLDLAFKNAYDHAFLITNDSDLAPAIKMIRQNFPEKRITTIAPPTFHHSNELILASSAKAKIQVQHLERCLLDDTIFNSTGHLIAQRPIEYAIPELVAL